MAACHLTENLFDALRTGELLAVRSDGTLLLLEDPLASGTVLDKCATPAVHYDAQLLDEPAAGLN